jgi:hypothetical protein
MNLAEKELENEFLGGYILPIKIKFWYYFEVQWILFDDLEDKMGCRLLLGSRCGLNKLEFPKELGVAIPC